MRIKKKLKEKMVLSSTPTTINFLDKDGNLKKFSARKCGQRMYLERDVKKFIKDLKEKYEWCLHYGRFTQGDFDVIDKLSGFAKRGKDES